MASHGGFQAWGLRRWWGQLGLGFRKIFLVLLEEGEPEAGNQWEANIGRGVGGSGPTSTREALEEKSG